ncbi:uncharacterized protein V1516DRAFT_675909 [Lipomyces oligophaga]|uniref:uncharacterized protein n=1 Tax=Lipomyces oligophaga TaxID=45792 RepID=UPI0034CE08D1
MKYARFGIGIFGASILFAQVLPWLLVYRDAESYDPAPASWPLPQKNDYRQLMTCTKYKSDDDYIFHFAKKILVGLFREQGIECSEEDVLRLPVPDFSNRDDVYVSGIVYIYAICGRIFADQDKLDDAHDVCLKGLSIHRRLDHHVSLLCIDLGRIANYRGDMKNAEKYFKMAIMSACGHDTKVKYHIDSLDGSISVAEDIALHCYQQIDTSSREFVVAASELALLYAQQGKSRRALPIYLAILKLIEDSSSDMKISPYVVDAEDEAKYRYYVSELLWDLGMRQDALDWAHQAYKDSAGCAMRTKSCEQVCKTAVLTKAKILRKLGREEEAAKEEELSKQIVASESSSKKLPFGVTM